MKFNIHRNISVRNVVQLLFAVIVLYIGVVFVIFTEQLANNSALTVSRPAGVEGFLPISALVGLKAWVVTGKFDPIHPAGLVIFLAAITLSVLFKRSFCAWICPIGTLSEGLAKIGKQIFGRNFQIPNWLDLCLRSLKYILLSVFLMGIFAHNSSSPYIPETIPSLPSQQAPGSDNLRYIFRNERRILYYA